MIVETGYEARDREYEPGYYEYLYPIASFPPIHIFPLHKDVS